MGVDATVALSQGDVHRRIRTLEKQVERLAADRNLEAASIGRGGLRLRGGRLLAEDQSGDRVFEVTTDPASIFMRQELISSLVEAIVEELLKSPAGQELAAFVFGQRVHSASVAATELTSSLTYTDLTTVGPTVSGVDISSSGRALVIATAETVASSTFAGGSFGQVAKMAFAISGATARSPNDDDAHTALFVDTDGNAFSGFRASATSLVTGLNEGVHTFTAKYKKDSGDDSVQFGDRNLTVMAF